MHSRSGTPAKDAIPRRPSEKNQRTQQVHYNAHIQSLELVSQLIQQNDERILKGLKCINTLVEIRPVATSLLYLQIPELSTI
jgi:hypothetical protein